MMIKHALEATKRSWQAWAASFCLLGSCGFALCALALQWLRADLDWQTMPLSFYLIGPYGIYLQSAYLWMSICLLLIGLLGYRLPQARRSSAPLLLFTLAAIALGTTALAHTASTPEPLSLHGMIHGVAAKASFLCLTSAMLLQAWRFRGVTELQQQARRSFALALACFIGLWLQLAPLGLSSAIKQKLLISLIICWLLMTCWQLLQVNRRV